jgi:protein SCO1/2
LHAQSRAGCRRRVKPDSIMNLVRLLSLVCTATLTACAAPQLRGGVFEPPQIAPEIALTTQNGKAYALSQQRGRVVLLFFGYTNCPDVCPTTLADAAAAVRKLGARGGELQVVFITVDPERDTAVTLQRYLALFNRDFVGLTGSVLDVQRATNAFQVVATRRKLSSASGYAIDHSAFTYLVDKRGMLRELLTFGAPVDDIVNDIRILLDE